MQTKFNIGDTLRIKNTDSYIIVTRINVTKTATFYGNDEGIYHENNLMLVSTSHVTEQQIEKSSQRHINELRSVLDEICNVLKLPGSPSYLELPKIIATRLEQIEELKQLVTEKETIYSRDADHWQKRNDELTRAVNRRNEALSKINNICYKIRNP